MKKKTKTAAIAWEIRGQLRHRGVIYSPGEPPPSMAIEEALAYEREGVLARVGAPRVVSHSAREIAVLRRNPPTAAASYLEFDDFGVLLFLEAHFPSQATLLEILDLAERTPRSLTLVQALKLLLDEPLSPAERALVGAAGMN